MMLNLQWKISRNASETIPTLFKFLQNTWKTLKQTTSKNVNLVKFQALCHFIRLLSCYEQTKLCVTNLSSVKIWEFGCKL